MGEYKLTMLYKKGLDYKTRNFILLLILLALTVISSVWLLHSLKLKHVELQKDNTKLNTDLANMRIQLTALKPLTEKLQKLQEEQFLTDKILPNDNNSTITLAYIFSLFRKYGNYFYFNFQMLNSGSVDKDKDVLFNRYLISGQVYINELFVFIDQFERQPSFYTIESIKIDALSAQDEGKVAFVIEFNAYYTKTGTAYEKIALRNITKRRVPYNIFYPRLYEPFIAEQDASLNDVTDYSLVGLTKNQVFVKNSKTGTVETLVTGSKVRHGNLKYIDWAKQEAVFQINRSGLLETVTLKK